MNFLDESSWSRDDVIVSLSYFVIALCIVFPPAEFINAGLTVQTVYGSWLGSEQLDFVNYHIRRTVATLAVHSVLPLGYFIALWTFSPNYKFSTFLRIYFTANGNVSWVLVVALTASIFISIIGFWKARSWLNGTHPMIKQLMVYNPADWKRVASEIATEMLRIDKFETGPPSRRLIITDSWLILTTIYNVHLVKKVDVRLRLKGCLDYSAHPEFGHSVQFLDIEVFDIAHSSTEKVLFNIRLSSLEYNELQTRVASPIENVRNIVIRQSLSDQFVEAFLRQIDENPRYHITGEQPEPDMCIGCMQKPANVKLQKLCDTDAYDGQPCQQCYCRPMWCDECLGRWFAARQHEQNPATWMTHQCPCPTCRATFCVLDICRIE